MSKIFSLDSSDKGSLNSIKTFAKGKLDIPFSDIDTIWLTKYD